MRVTSPDVPVHMRFSKFDGSPHWRTDARLLGEDAFGWWFGCGPGSSFDRPGLHVEMSTSWVSLVPRDRRFVLTRYAKGGYQHAEFYLDLTTVPAVHRGGAGEGLTITAIDLDLDVVKRFGQVEAWIDDEDEFAEHSLRWNYPQDLIEATRAEADRLVPEVSSGVEPFGEVSRAWLAQLP